MKKPTRWTRWSLLALSGGVMTVFGTVLPWTRTVGAGSPLVQRGIDTPVGMLIAVLGVAMLVTALLRVRGARSMLLLFGWAAAFWMLVIYQQGRTSMDTLTFGPGWYCAWTGIGLTLINAHQGGVCAAGKRTLNPEFGPGGSPSAVSVP